MTSLYQARVDLEAEVSALLAMLGDEALADEALDLAAPWAACQAAMAKKAQCRRTWQGRGPPPTSRYGALHTASALWCRVNHGFGVSVGVRMLKSTEIRQECMSAGRRPAAGK